VPALRGGATEKAWHEIAKSFAGLGHSVTFISRRWQGLANSEEQEGIRHIRVQGFDHTAHTLFNLVLDFIWGLRVARVLPRGDIVICNTVTLPAWLGPFKRPAGLVAVMIGRIPKGQARFYRNVARIYVPSVATAALISPPWASARTRVIGYPIDWSKLSKSSHQSGSPVTIGFVGRLHPEKGIGLLVKAACLIAARGGLPHWSLKIVGPASVVDGGGGQEWLSALRAESQSTLGDRVEWLPPEFDPARLAFVYGGLDVFCYPSLAEKGETFGVSVAEAMAARCAVVVSKLSCFSELVAEGETGLVFDHAAADADMLLANCLDRLIREAGFRNELANRGQLHARRFDTAEVSQRILEDLSLLTGAGTEKGE
jgi:glycosyltransferase involved in cell wall biosynthesis